MLSSNAWGLALVPKPFAKLRVETQSEPLFLHACRVVNIDEKDARRRVGTAREEAKAPLMVLVELVHQRSEAVALKGVARF